MLHGNCNHSNYNIYLDVGRMFRLLLINRIMIKNRCAVVRKCIEFACLRILVITVQLTGAGMTPFPKVILASDSMDFDCFRGVE